MSSTSTNPSSANTKVASVEATPNSSINIMGPVPVVSLNSSSEVPTSHGASITPVVMPAKTSTSAAKVIPPAGAPISAARAQGAGNILATKKSQVVPSNGLASAGTTKGKSQSASKRSKSSKRKQPAVTMATAVTASNAGSTGGENTGRWTAEEHRLFLQGLDQHGKGWKKIASLIKSRTVVQIRTHAQKYFQKLAKARQNGEEGDVTMEGRGGMMAGGSGTHVGQSQKKKRQLSGTKRKSISSVVASVTKESKGVVSGQTVTVVPVAAVSLDGKTDAPPPSLPSIAPALQPFVVAPHSGGSGVGQTSPAPSLTPAVLEDSLYRYLTPVTGENFLSDPTSSNSVEAIPSPVVPPGNSTTIKLPETISSGTIMIGESSPTSVADITFPTFDPKEPPQWFAKGADVEDLLEEADTLDWLADSGDLEETYNLSSKGNSAHPPASEMASMCSTTVSESSAEENDPTPTVVSELSSSQDLGKPSVSSASISTDAGMMTLPALFDQQKQPEQQQEQLPPSKMPKTASDGVFTSATEAVEASLPAVSSASNINDELAVFDSAFDEQAFVSALLESNDGASANISGVSLS